MTAFEDAFRALPEAEQVQLLAIHAQRQPPPVPDGAPRNFPTWLDLDALIGPITWAWPGWLPNGFVTLLVSEPGFGKSNLALRTSATFFDERFDTWPDGTPYTGQRGRVVWAEAEQGQAIHKERAEAWGLDKSNFVVPTFGQADDDFSLDDPGKWQALQEAAYLPDVRLIVIDSLSAANSRRENSSEDMIELVKQVAVLARDCQKPVLLTHHLRKRGLLDGDGVNLDRVRGSGAIVQPARVVWALDTPDLLDKDTRRLSQVKNNLRRAPEPLGMQINDNGVSFVAAPEAEKPISQQEAAINFLIALLQSEPLAAERVYEEARLAGHSDRTIKRAKDKIGVVSLKKGGGGGAWLWSLPVKQ